MAEIIITNKRRKLSLNECACCFCFKPFEDNISTKLNLKFLDTLLDACQENSGNEASIYLLENQHEIRNGNITIRYHKMCRSGFMRNRYRDEPLTPVTESNSENFTRSKDCQFDWAQNCFICGGICSPKKRSTWSLVKSATSLSSPICFKLMGAAQAKNDQALMKRILSVNGDLCAAKARYHRTKSCLANYLSLDDNKDSPTSNEKENLDSVCLEVKNKLEEHIVQNGKVYELNEVKKCFFTVSKEKGLCMEHIKTKTVKRLFRKYWPEVQFISRPGLSTIVCSTSVDLDHAMAAACKYGQLLSSVETENSTTQSLSNSFLSNEDDNQILHKAAGILRERIRMAEKLKDQYYSHEELGLEQQRRFVGDDVYKFFSWLTSKDHYENISHGEELDVHTLAICCDVIYATTGIASPKHIGLSVHLHHLYGSRKLIDDLHTLGYTVGYTEIRRFLSSAAIHMFNQQEKTESGALVPDNIRHAKDGGNLVVGVCDNWDHNECTRNGKDTTHAMTSIIVSPKSNKTGRAQRIQRVLDTTLSNCSTPGADLSSVLTYEKPTERPLPYFRVQPTSKEDIHPTEPVAAKITRMKELLYNMGRLHLFCDDRFQSPPPWTIFQSQISPDQLQESSYVVFNPIIMSAPTQCIQH